MVEVKQFKKNNKVKEKKRMEKEMYVLNVLDYDDDYIYYSLLLNSSEDVWLAKEIILNFDSEWYNVDDDFRDTHNYTEELIERLNAHEELHFTILNVANIYVR